MRLSRWDIAEGLGLTYEGTVDTIPEEDDGAYNYVHSFCLRGKIIEINGYSYSEEEAKEKAAEELFDNLITLLGG
jgi:hypothetical protein